MTTLADVAAAAGVSKAAASLVLSGKSEGRVSEPKAERVRTAAEELGYVRDAIAGGMRNGRTQTIGVIGERVLSTPYAVSMIDSVLSTSQDLGWSVLLTDAGRDGVAAEEAVREMVARRVNQVVIASMYHRVVSVPEQIEDVVVLNGVADRPGVPGVVPDERQAPHDAVAHLIGQG
ncbi:MAG: LacI family DNA-binding transcriptional regulator, partial [Pauljensenia sp.]